MPYSEYLLGLFRSDALDAYVIGTGNAMAAASVTGYRPGDTTIETASVKVLNVLLGTMRKIDEVDAHCLASELDPLIIAHVGGSFQKAARPSPRAIQRFLFRAMARAEDERREHALDLLSRVRQRMSVGPSGMGMAYRELWYIDRALSYDERTDLHTEAGLTIPIPPHHRWPTSLM